MVFSSGLFLFIFLPLVLGGYWLLRKRDNKIKNLFLLMMSFFFYLKTGIYPFLLLVFSIIMNYIFAIKMVHNKEWKKAIFILAIGFNVGILFVFKYFGFIYGELANVFASSQDTFFKIILPLGISFYTFQAISYLCDVYRDESLLESSLLNVATYISFFPQLVAGPIVRWDKIRDNINGHRECDLDGGLKRFAIGLGKKVIIANQMAIFADKAFALCETNELSMGMAWLGAIAYTLQIYFDFSGYSDMAIGLGRIFGFTFPENFNYPYISKSITEFWRRWHMSLSSWFKDYVYIPLGGNRYGNIRKTFNLLVVWSLTGIWHGANYTFWLWGFLYFCFLIIEKNVNINIFEHQYITHVKNVMSHMYTLLVVILLWVIFRADTVTQAMSYIRCMFIPLESSLYADAYFNMYFKNFLGYGIVAIIGATPWTSAVKKFLSENVSAIFEKRLSDAYILGIFILACCVTVDSNYNPFIYFNF